MQSKASSERLIQLKRAVAASEGFTHMAQTASDILRQPKSNLRQPLCFWSEMKGPVNRGLLWEKPFLTPCLNSSFSHFHILYRMVKNKMRASIKWNPIELKKIDLLWVNFTIGQTFWLIWQNTFQINWQHFENNKFLVNIITEVELLYWHSNFITKTFFIIH
jgi:hypothetical protein